MDTKKRKSADRLKQLMNERNMKQVDLLEFVKPYANAYNVKFGKSTISQYVTGKVEPGQDKLSVLALAFNVNEAWLMGYDLPRDREMPTSVNEDGHSCEMISLFSLLTEQEKLMIIAQIKGILSSR